MNTLKSQVKPNTDNELKITRMQEGDAFLNKNDFHFKTANILTIYIQCYRCL